MLMEEVAMLCLGIVSWFLFLEQKLSLYIETKIIQKGIIFNIISKVVLRKAYINFIFVPEVLLKLLSYSDYFCRLLMLNSDYMDRTSNGIDTMCFLQHWHRAICVLLTLADFWLFWWPRLRLSLRKIGEMTREEWYAFDLTLLINHGLRWYRRNVKDQQRLYFCHLTLLGLWFQWVALESCSVR